MLGDLWSLTVSESSSGGAWSELDPEGKAPHVRCSQAVAPVENDIFFLGGSYYKCAILHSHVLIRICFRRLQCSRGDLWGKMGATTGVCQPIASSVTLNRLRKGVSMVVGRTKLLPFLCGWVLLYL